MTASKPSSFRNFRRLILSGVCCFAALPAQAQLIRTDLSDGFVRTSSIDMSVDEMLGYRKSRPDASQPIVGPGWPNLWIAEVQYKPVRHVRLEVEDPRTGTSQRELIWYMVWRAIPRDCTEVAGPGRDDLLKKLRDPDFDPVNNVDSISARAVQIPRFTLTTDDGGPQLTYVDEVNPQIQQTVLAREFGDTSNLQLLNSSEAIVEIGKPVSVNDPDALSAAVYGVAIWRNVDGDTDYFTVTMSGFSNAYRITPDGAGQMKVEHKVIRQKFGRPGDRFAPREWEFRVLGDPEWVYEQRPGNLTVPDFEPILRNARGEQPAAQ